MRNLVKKIAKNRSGITLISLVVTIIILLILAGISIGMLSGDNSIIKQAGNAKTQTDIAQEKEILEQATVVAMGKSKYGNVEKQYLDPELNKYAEIDGTEEVDDGIQVTFKSSRAYLVNTDGDISEDVIVDRTGINIGDYITYTSPTESVSLSTTETGYTNEQTLTRKTLFRVLEIKSNGSMVLIGAMTTSDQKIIFQKELGYNNAVFTLNTKCSDLYKNETKRITARSIKVEDITDKFNENGKEKINTYVTNQLSTLSAGTCITNIDIDNNTVTYNTSGQNGYYPDIFKYEIGGILDETATSGEIGQSESYIGYGGVTSSKRSRVSTSFTVPYTACNTTHESGDFEDTNKAIAYQNIFFETSTNYWIASRSIKCNTGSASFGLRCVSSR